MLSLITHSFHNINDFKDEDIFDFEYTCQQDDISNIRTIEQLFVRKAEIRTESTEK